MLLKATSLELDALRNFCELRDRIRATGSVFVSYQRHAYMVPNSDKVRVTFDRELESRPYRDGGGLAMPAKGRKPQVGGVVFELKFTDQFPAWMRELVWAFNLQRVSVPKYVKCLSVMRNAPGRRGRLVHDQM